MVLEEGLREVMKTLSGEYQFNFTSMTYEDNGARRIGFNLVYD